MILETNRLILRRYREEDLRDLYEYLSDEEVVKYEPYRPMDLREVQEELTLGFEKEAYFKQNVYFWKDQQGKPIWKDTFVYSLLKP